KSIAICLFWCPIMLHPSYNYFTTERICAPLCQQVQILTAPLLKVIKRFAFRQNTPNQFVGYFDAAFLIRGTGIAIENKTAKLIVFILFDGDRIAELTATVSQNDRKESTIGVSRPNMA
uniref:hypothetical protein n=1 Tax=Dysosmobacter sp. TaxID=2591382 RepID=UPI003AF08E41